MSTATPADVRLLDDRTKAFIVAGSMLGLFLAALDQTIVSTAIPNIVADLQGLDLLSWVTNSYLLASTAMVPIYGKLSDIYGRKAILLTGIVLFVAASVLCGVAGSMESLIAFRGLQGLGAAALTSTAFAVVADLYEAQKRAKIQGLFGAVFGLSSVIGPLLGGYLTEHFSWRSVFYVNVPVGALVITFILAKMPALRSGVRVPIDWLGSLFLVGFTVPILLAMTLDRNLYPWSSLTTIGLLVGGIVSLGVFLWAETKAESPVLPLRLFRNAQFTSGVAFSFVFGGAFFSGIIFVPLFMQRVVGVSPSESGTTMTPLTIGLVIAAMGAGQISARIGKTKPFILSAVAVVGLAYVLMGQLNAASTRGDVVWRMVLLGLGLGPNMPLMNLVVQNAVSRQDIGIATSARQFFQQLGSVFAAAILGAVLTSQLQTGIPAKLQPVLDAMPPQARASMPAFDPAKLGSGEGRFAKTDGPPPYVAGINATMDAQKAVLQKAFEGAPGERATILGNPMIPPPIKGLFAPEKTEISPPEQAMAFGILEKMREGMMAGAKKTFDDVKEAIRQAFAEALANLFLSGSIFAALAFLVALTIREKQPDPAASAVPAAPVEM